MNDPKNLLIKQEYDLQKLPIDEDTTDEQLKEIIEGNITYFLTQLGEGFMFVGKDYPLNTNGNEVKIGLLFYHEKHQRYLTVDVSIGEFQSGYVGKVNEGLNAIIENLKPVKDPIGLILCKIADEVTVEYALKGLDKDIVVSTYQYKKLPKQYKSELPSNDELETVAKGKEPINSLTLGLLSIIVFLLLSWLIITITYDNLSALKLGYWLNVGILEAAAIPISLILPLHKKATWLIGLSVLIVLTFLRLNFA